MTRFLIFLLALFWAGVALVALAPRFFDADFLAKDIERRLSAATGHQVTVSDQVAFQLLPSPAFQVTDLAILRKNSSVSEIVDGSGELMTAEAVTLHVQPWALVFGQFQAARVEVIAPQIRLTRDAEGITAWQNAPIFAALTAPSALLRDQDNRRANQRGLSSQVEFVAATVHVQDLKTDFDDRLIIPRLAIEPVSDGRAMRVDFDFERDNWMLTGTGQVGLLPDNGNDSVGVSGRLFSASLSGQHQQSGASFEELTIEGALTDLVLDRLEVREADGWRMAMRGYESRDLQGSVGKVLKADTTKLDVLSDRIRLDENGLALSAAEFQLTTSSGRQETQLTAQGGLEYRANTETGSAMALNLALVDKVLPEEMMNIAGLANHQDFGLFRNVLSADQAEIDIKFSDLTSLGSPDIQLDGAVTMLMNAAQTSFHDVSLVRGELFAAEIEEILTPGDDGLLRATGSFSALSGRNDWLKALMPDLWALSPSSEKIEFTGSVALDLLGDGLGTIISPSLRYDTDAEFDYHRQVDEVTLSTGALDLRWLNTGPVRAELGGAEDTDAELSAVLSHGAGLADLQARLGATNLNIRVDDGSLGRLSLGRTAITVQSGQDNSSLVSIETTGELALDANLAFNLLETGQYRLQQAATLLEPSVGRRQLVGYSQDWSGISYLTLDDDQDLGVSMQRDTSSGVAIWAFEQNNHRVRIDTGRGLVAWQKSPSALDQLVVNRVGSRALLLSGAPVASRGTAQLTNPTRQASTLIASQNGQNVSLSVEASPEALTIGSDGLNPLAILPNFGQFELTLDGSGGDQLEIFGDGWSVEGMMSRTDADLTLRASAIRLDQALDAIATIEFTDTLLTQGEFDLAVELDRLLDQGGNEIAKNIALDGTFSGGRFTVDTLTATLAGGDTLTARGQADLLAGVFGRFDFELLTIERALGFGPYTATLKPGVVAGQLNIAGADASEMINGLNLTLTPSKLAIDLQASFENLQGWGQVMETGEGAALERLIPADQSLSYQVTGNVNFRNGQWRTSGLDFSPTASETPSLFAEGSYFTKSDVLDGSVRAIVPTEPGQEARQAILATSGVRSQPTLRLLGTYFRE